MNASVHTQNTHTYTHARTRAHTHTQHKSLIESKSLFVFYIYIINIYKVKHGGEKLDQDLTRDSIVARSIPISVQSV